MSDHLAPDDPRHGTTTGYRRGCRDSCCRRAMADSMARRRARLYLARTDSLSVPAYRVHRRIQALVALGWSLSAISRTAGYHRSHVGLMLTRHANVSEPTAQRIFDVYDELCMTLPPQDTPPERVDATRARNIAQRKGWAPPLAYDDIDDPHAEPIGVRGKAEPKHAWIDPIVVNELLAGRTVDSTPGEKTEAMRRWLAAGKSARSLEVRHGWHSGRYMPRRQEESA